MKSVMSCFGSFLPVFVPLKNGWHGRTMIWSSWDIHVWLKLDEDGGWNRGRCRFFFPGEIVFFCWWRRNHHLDLNTPIQYLTVTHEGWGWDLLETYDHPEWWLLLLGGRVDPHHHWCSDFWQKGLGLGNQSWCLSALPSGCDLCLDTNSASHEFHGKISHLGSVLWICLRNVNTRLDKNYAHPILMTQKTMIYTTIICISSWHTETVDLSLFH